MLFKIYLPVFILGVIICMNSISKNQISANKLKELAAINKQLKTNSDVKFQAGAYSCDSRKAFKISTATASISNIINTYTPVIVIGLNPCENKITVEDASGFNIGDTVLMIQMKGATVDSSNTSFFGTTTAYKSAGNYELNYIKNKNGNEIELVNKLTRSYEIPEGYVQLIRVPYYDNVTVDSTLTCLSWDGKKGGVLVLNVQNEIELNADIDVSGKGFMGGTGINTDQPLFNCSENQFYYSPNGDLAAPKGEGISNVSIQKSYGKGQLANAGGGGNSHNSGGGGGGNAAFGGNGGYQLESSPCYGSGGIDNRGLAGIPLSYNNTENKIYMGGGGGAGHDNNPENFRGSGGNGGGIVIIIANSITGNSKNILSKGNGAVECSLSGLTACHEGMGGGGAGGTVLLNTSQVNGNLTVNISGGKGGDMVAPGSYTRVGPGGGGSGGTCWFSNNAIPTGISISANGGINGVCTKTSNTSWGASPGGSGISLFDLKIPADTILFVPCTVPVNLSSFIVTTPENKYLQLDWHTEEESNIINYVIERATSVNSRFISVGVIKAANKNSGNDYTFTDNSALKDIKYFYRLKINELNSNVKYSSVKNGILKTGISSVNIFPNPAGKYLSVQIDKTFETAFIYLYNNLGQMIEKKKISNLESSITEFNTSKLQSGIYLIKVVTDQETIIRKFEKQ